MIKLGRLDSYSPICLVAPAGPWRVTNVRRMINLSLCTIPAGDYLPLGSYKLPNDLLLFLAEGLRQHSTVAPISLQKFSPRDRQCASAAVNDCKKVARTQGKNSQAEIVPRNKYGAFGYHILNFFYYYSNDLFFHFKMKLDTYFLKTLKKFASNLNSFKTKFKLK